MSVFSERLRSTMKKNGITQAQLSSLTHIPKSAISQYLSDKFKPRQKRIGIISSALGVNPAWLCGYDALDGITVGAKKISLSEHERAIINAYRTSPDFKKRIDKELAVFSNEGTFDVFRVAKSEDGTVAPTKEEITAARLSRLANAPQTTEDL